MSSKRSTQKIVVGKSERRSLRSSDLIAQQCGSGTCMACKRGSGGRRGRRGRR